MFDFRVGEIMRLLARTSPFILLRLGVYLGITLAYVLAVGVGAGIGMLFGAVAGTRAGGAAWGGLAGFGIISGLLYLGREYLLYLVKAGHIAVLAELMDGREIPAGKGQIQYGTGVVKDRFVQASSLFVLDRLIQGVLRVFNRTTMRVANFIPVPGLEAVMKLVNAIVNTSVTWLDEVILAQIFRQRSDNPWATARDSVVLYAQNWKSVLKNAAALTFLVWGMTLVVFLVVLGPIAALVALFPGVAGFWTFAFALILALALKAALVDPFAMAGLMQVYKKVTEGQHPDPAWTQRLDSMSGKFRDLAGKARGAGPRPTPAEAPAAQLPPGG